MSLPTACIGEVHDPHIHKLYLHVRLRLKIDPTALPKAGSSVGEAVGSIFSLNLACKESYTVCFYSGKHLRAREALEHR